MQRASGKTYRDLRMKASRYRKKMIRTRTKRVRARNRKYHEADDLPKFKYRSSALRKQMSPKYREALKIIERSKSGRQALRKYRSFIGLPFPTEIIFDKVPGPKNKFAFVTGMGKNSVVLVADGPRDKHKKIRKFRGKFRPIFTSDGKNIALIRAAGKNFGKGLKFIGFAPETHYVPTREMEKAGSFKSGKYWVHEHHDEGGKWPKVFKDKAGNFFYDRGTYRVGKWIRK